MAKDEDTRSRARAGSLSDVLEDRNGRLAPAVPELRAPRRAAHVRAPSRWCAPDSRRGTWCWSTAGARWVADQVRSPRVRCAYCSRVRLAAPETEAAEAAQFDLLTTAQRFPRCRRTRCRRRFSACLLVRPATVATSSMSAAFVKLPSVMSSPVAARPSEHIGRAPHQRRRAASWCATGTTLRFSFRGSDTAARRSAPKSRGSRACRPRPAMRAPDTLVSRRVNNSRSGRVGGKRRDPTESRSRLRSRGMPAPTNDFQLIELRYEEICPDCGVKLKVGTQAYWSPGARGQAWCRLCVRLRPLEARIEALERQRDGDPK